MEVKTPPNEDMREALYNDRRVGLVGQIQMPREAVTRLHGLMVDLDANLLKANPWFAPADTPQAFYNAIAPTLDRHPILSQAEIRDTGRWLHAITWFSESVELRSAAEQRRWASLHRILMGSVPSDPAAPVLNALTRPVASINSKTGAAVTTLKQGKPVPAARLEQWAEETRQKPFETIGTILFGSSRVSPCPYCNQAGSQFDLGALNGFCYGSCRSVSVRRLFEPFLQDPAQQETPVAPEEPSDNKKSRRKKKQTSPEAKGEAANVIVIDQDVVLEIDPQRVHNLTIRLKTKPGKKTS